MFTTKSRGVSCAIVVVLGALLAVITLPRLFVNAGLLSLLHGNDGLARHLLWQAHSLVPDNRSLLVMYLDRLSEQGRYSEAMPVLNSYLNRHPDDRMLKLRALDSSARSGDINTSKKWLAELNDLSSISPEAAAVLAADALRPDGGYTFERALALASIAFHWPDGGAELSPGVRALLNGESHKDAASIRDAILWRARSVVQKDIVEATYPITSSLNGSLVLQTPISQELRLQLGPNLAINGGFETMNHLTAMPSSWRPAVWQGGNQYSALGYVMGTDPDAYEGNAALRMVIAKQLPIKDDFEASRVGVWHQPVVLEPGKPYVISFVYQATADIVRVYFNEQDDQFSREVWLPETSNQWHRVNIMAVNQSMHPLLIQPLLRIWGEGSAKIDDFSIRKVVEPRNIKLDTPVVTVKQAGG